MAPRQPDPSSYANSEEIRVENLRLNLEVDFDKCVLRGAAQLRCRALVQDVGRLVLDSKRIKINSVGDSISNWRPLLTDLHEDDAFGEGLELFFKNPLPVDEVITVDIAYETSPNCSATQWLPPEQTNGKKYPYMFTQCQAIHARSLVPIQDTPSVKFTYSATVTVPEPLVAVMSALPDTNITSGSTFAFNQPVPIPSYLLALAVGNLEKRDIGPRSAVWSEPEFVKTCAEEFSDTEAMVETAESLLGPYEWGRYDLLVLPASFPYGGMENPCLTFVTPTIIAGDKSLVDVVAHEISHSWTGNLVTNYSWESFWLNEGFTMFVERKIAGRMHGEAARQLSSRLGVQSLQKTVDQLGKDNRFTALNIDLEGVDPDECYSTVPYEKGYNFLYYLETCVGGPEVFDKYLRKHIEHFRRKSVTTEQWKEFMLDYFRAQGLSDKLKQVDWEAWLNGLGMPPVENKFDDSLGNAAQKLAQDWLAAEAGEAPSSANDYVEFNPMQKMVFLDVLLEKAPLEHGLLTALDKSYSLSQVRNSEVRFRWQMVSLRSRDSSVIPQVIAFVSEQGRMKYVRPLFRALQQVDAEQAKKTLNELKASYHPICYKMILADLVKSSGSVV